ncbi:DUF3267 domain-containing protein [Dyadobacter sp. CY312]|uniref:DUF3267 domain-containing protein n=1 Tax=Dyadobacter sp. CY312 TaxID=2907303 RepID=UPI001F43C15F|nr:DUF3267 domain-containing protein [Dyadobacter sp. CY312]MCE7041420.1 DUF3267 domain-containing protein [Dyadobacter sp. CY312]
MKHIELTEKSGTVQLYGFVVSIALYLVLLTPFEKLYGKTAGIGDKPALVWIGVLSVFLLGIGIHELIHYLTAIWYGRISLTDVKLGIKWKTLTPYFHSKVPVLAKKYRVITVMPLVVMGIVPYIISMLIGNGWVLAFGIVFILTAFGDLFILWLMRHVPGDQLVQDHPDKIGLIVLSEE